MADPKRPMTPPRTPRAPPAPVIEEADLDGPTEVIARPSFAELSGPETIMPEPPGDGGPTIEIEFVQQKGRAAVPQAMWGMADIFTKNRIYRVNSMLTCIEVIDRATGKSDPRHAMLGARMGGGQRREKGRVEIADPLPLPGMDVVFKQTDERGGKFGHTSRVERVVLRIRVCAFRVDNTQPVWEEITSQFTIADLKARAKNTR
jgi:hypothetical protein